MRRERLSFVVNFQRGVNSVFLSVSDWCWWIFKGRTPPHCLSWGGSLNCCATFPIPCIPLHNPWGHTQLHAPLRAQPPGATHSISFSCVHMLPMAHPVHTAHPLRSHTVPCTPVCMCSWKHAQNTLRPCVNIPWGHTQYPAPLCAHPPEGTHSTHWTPVCTHPWKHTLLRALTFSGLLPQLKIFPNTLDRNCSWSLCWQFKGHTFYPKVRSKCIPSFMVWDSYTLRLVCFEVWADPGQAPWKWALSVLQTPSISLAWLSSKSCS